MRVAVCDDQALVLEELKDMLEELQDVQTVHLYSNIETFFSVLKEKEYYDVVLMDIDWKNERTGLDFAEELKSLSPYTQIIYVTAYTMEYIEDIFLRQSNLSGFLMKPVRKEQLERNLEKVRSQQRGGQKKLVIRYKKRKIVIPFQDILYLESQLHKVKICLVDQEYLCSENLTNLRKKLDEQFLSCHKSFVVNMNYILEFQNNAVILEGDKRIPVSKARYGEAKSKFFTYVSEGL